ncbi:hypothetical protein [Streptomyces stephensoniae]|uniref:hypothetical protein n=1 Tax=Streptomyces stephensoniae TaxID=3375367 RepID=UPI002888FEA4|nr:hypothetical protein [Streptomyces griseus]
MLSSVPRPRRSVGGTADQMWDARLAESLPHEALEVPSADHSLELADDAEGSVEVMRQVVSRLDRFIGSLAR